MSRIQKGPQVELFNNPPQVVQLFAAPDWKFFPGLDFYSGGILRLKSCEGICPGKILVVKILTAN
jgi:hypothetical protein